MLEKAISKNERVGYNEIHDSFAASSYKILGSQAPLKNKYVRGNHSAFVNEFLSKAIMVRIKLMDIFLKNRSEENKINYNKQRNLYVTLLRRSRKEYYKKT